MAKHKYIDAGKIINTHGIKGDVKIEVWLDNAAFLKQFKRIFIDGDEYTVRSASVQKDFLLSHIGGVDSIEKAESLKGKVIRILREDAALDDSEFFYCEVIGASAFDESGKLIGIVSEVFETPASAVYVIKGKEEHYVPDVPEFIMSVDCENNRMTVRLIDGM